MKFNLLLTLVATTFLFACEKKEVTVIAPAAPVENVAPMVEPLVAVPAETAPVELAVPGVTVAPAPATPPAAISTPVKTPPAQAAAKTPAAISPAPAAAPPVVPESVIATPKPDLAHGQKIYQQSCAVCHDKGIAGAPKLGDAAAWSGRLAQGTDTLYNTALRGKGAMPAKGGNPSLTDNDTKSAVDFLISQSR